MNLSAVRADLTVDRGHFRGLGDQANAAKRSYSAGAALCFWFLLQRLSEPCLASIKTEQAKLGGRYPDKADPATPRCEGT